MAPDGSNVVFSIRLPAADEDGGESGVPEAAADGPAGDGQARSSRNGVGEATAADAVAPESGQQQGAAAWGSSSSGSGGGSNIHAGMRPCTISAHAVPGVPDCRTANTEYPTAIGAAAAALAAGDGAPAAQQEWRSSTSNAPAASRNRPAAQPPRPLRPPPAPPANRTNSTSLSIDFTLSPSLVLQLAPTLGLSGAPTLAPIMQLTRQPTAAYISQVGRSIQVHRASPAV